VDTRSATKNCLDYTRDTNIIDINFLFHAAGDVTGRGGL
jgi:hypothetical protein